MIFYYKNGGFSAKIKQTPGFGVCFMRWARGGIILRRRC